MNCGRAAKTRHWQTLGFTRRNLKPALLWGLAAGILWAGWTVVLFRSDKPLPPLWGLQVAIALPIWFLIWSPFQEVFFRGWLQPRLQTSFGQSAGLLLAALAFTVWHFFPQLENTPSASLPLSSTLGIASIFLAGLLSGYVFQRTGNILAPWLAHALGGIALVVIGEMSFLQYSG